MAFSELCKELLKEPAREPSLGEEAIGILKNTSVHLGELTSSISDPAKILSLSITIITEELTTDQRLDKVIRMHYEKGLSYLKDVQLAQEELNQKRRMERWQEAQNIQAEMRYVIRAALDEFKSAVSVDEPLIAAKAEFFVGECYDFLNLKKPALERYQEAYVRGQREILKKLAVYPPIRHMTIYRREAYEKYKKISFRMKLMFMDPFSTQKYAISPFGYGGKNARQIYLLTDELINQYLSHAMSAFMLISPSPLASPSKFFFPKEEIKQINDDLEIDLLTNPEENAKNIKAFLEAFLSKPFPPIPTNQFIGSLYNFPPMRETSQYEAEFLKPLSVFLSRRK
jgi:hypothetical protein